jgi:hypothetical protein
MACPRYTEFQRITAALVRLQQPPTLDNNVALLMMVQLVDEIGEAFGELVELPGHGQDFILRRPILRPRRTF